MAAPGPERRRFARQGISDLQLQLPVAGRVLNASVRGLAVETSVSLQLGWSYAFRMISGTRVIRIPGKVRWCRLVSTRRGTGGEVVPVYRMGIAMTGSIWDSPRAYPYPYP